MKSTENKNYGKKLLPVLNGNQLIIYVIEKKEEFNNYIDCIKEKYGYIDIRINEKDLLVKNSPISLNDDNILYDILSYEIINVESQDNYRVDGIRKCESISELLIYPKLYNIIKNTFDNEIIKLGYLAEYYIDQQYTDKKKNKILKKSIEYKSKRKINHITKYDMIMKKTIKLDNDIKIQDIKEEIKKIHEYISIDLMYVYDFEDLYEKAAKNISIEHDYLTEKIFESFFIGAQNKKVIDFFDLEFNKQNENKKQYRK